MKRSESEGPKTSAAIAALRAQADPERARVYAWFFETGPGQYGEGDEFLGRRLPQIRALARTFAALPLGEIEKILASTFHEARLFALIVLVRRYEKADGDRREAAFHAYIDNIDKVNNRDLVDLSARIIGLHLQHGDPAFLYDLVESGPLWHHRNARRGYLDMKTLKQPGRRPARSRTV